MSSCDPQSMSFTGCTANAVNSDRHCAADSALNPNDVEFGNLNTWNLLLSHLPHPPTPTACLNLIREGRHISQSDKTATRVQVNFPVIKLHSKLDQTISVLCRNHCTTCNHCYGWQAITRISKTNFII